MTTQHRNAMAMVLLALMLTGTCALAGDLPAAAQRIWAPTGDQIGTDNHATAAFEAMDAYGSPAKIGEDWQRLEDQSGAALFNWQKVFASGYKMGLRGYGTTQTGESLNGHLNAWGKRPGSFSYALSFRQFDQFSDPTSEMRSATFGLPPAPPTLAVTPVLQWQRSDAVFRHRLNAKFGFDAGIRSICRDGDKGSLLRAATGNAVPGVKSATELSSREAWLGLDYASGAFAADLKGAFRFQQGDRSLGDHAYDEDRTQFRAGLGLQWQASATTRLFGFGSLAKLDNKGSETYQTATVTTGGETKANGGGVAVIHRLGRTTTVRAAANFQKTETEAVGRTTAQAVDRSRSRQEYRLNLVHTGVQKTRLELGYRLRATAREEILTDVSDYTTDQDQTRQDLVFKARHRLSRKALVKLQAGWSTLEREEMRDWTDPSLKYWIDDYKRSQVDLKLALQTRPHTLVRLDLGGQIIDRTFENQITDGVETTFKANRGYANLNWLPRDWLTVYGMASLGLETYEMGDAVAPAAGMGPLNHDATTVRFVPGVVAQVTSTVQAEAMYELMRTEDTADSDGDLAALQSDHDRMLLRLTWQAREKLSVAATYRRYEFSEQRWDNTIHDLYGLALTGRF